MPSSRSAARDFSRASIPSRIDEEMRLSSRYSRTRPIATSRTCEPNMVTSRRRPTPPRGSGEDGQRVGLHVGGHVVTLPAAVLLLVEDGGALLADAADQTRMEHHLRRHPQRFSAGPGRGEPDRADALRDELPLLAEVLPGSVERLVLDRQRLDLHV